MENVNLTNMSVKEYLNKLSSVISAPGGGSAAGFAGAAAVSLVMMVIGIVNKKKVFPEGFYDSEYKKLKEIKQSFLRLCDKDAEIYAKFKKTKNKDSKEYNMLLKDTIYIPVEICKNCILLNKIIIKLISYVNTSLINDIDGALRFNKTAFTISKNNIKSNINKTNNKSMIYNDIDMSCVDKIKDFDIIREKIDRKTRSVI